MWVSFEIVKLDTVNKYFEWLMVATSALFVFAMSEYLEGEFDKDDTYANSNFHAHI